MTTPRLSALLSIAAIVGFLLAPTLASAHGRDHSRHHDEGHDWHHRPSKHAKWRYRDDHKHYGKFSRWEHRRDKRHDRAWVYLDEPRHIPHARGHRPHKRNLGDGLTIIFR